MLPPFIIDQIRRREDKERVKRDSPMVELPLESPLPREQKTTDDEPKRGVVIIDLG